MKSTHHNILPLFMCLLTFASCNQQQKPDTTSAGTPGDFDRTILPILPHLFAGIVDTNAQQSKPDFPVEVAAPSGAPNVLIMKKSVTAQVANLSFGQFQLG